MQLSDTTPAGKLFDGPVEIVRLWKSPRNRKQTIVIAIKEYAGHIFLDCRLFDTNTSGQTVPTAKGVTVGMAKLEEFAAGIAKAVTTAKDLGLIDDEAAE